jgi:hypothetical protein
VVGHEVDGDPDAVRVGVRDQVVHGVEVAPCRVDAAVVGDVVAVVDHRGGVDGAEPQRVDAEQLQVAQAATDPLQVAEPVAVGVGEAGHVDLVEDGVPPPLHGGILAETRRVRPVS